MITNISIRNFKCFESLDLELGALTLLTGYNSSGKSTAIQPLLLLAQGLRSGQLPSKRFPLNGRFVRLGSAGDVLPLDSENATIEFAVSTSSDERSWELRAKAGDRVLLDASGSDDSTSEAEKANTVIRAVRGLSFISAIRLGAPDHYPMPDMDYRRYRDVGFDGRFAPFEYHRFADDVVPESRWLPGASGDSVRKHVDSWLSWLFPKAQANVQYYPDLSALSLQFRVSEFGEWRRPINVGYGYSYAFPIVVALLTARSGQTIVIDSPEAHLHPRAQSMMGWMLATFAQAGVQIVVESHSDHVLNGIRRAVREQILTASQARIYFFAGTDSNVATGSARVKQLLMSDGGSLNSWPRGFFDQLEDDLSQL